MTRKGKLWLIGVTSLPFVVAVPVVFAIFAIGFASQILGQDYPLGVAIAAFVVGIFTGLAAALWICILIASGDVRKVGRALLVVLGIDVLALPTLWLLVAIVTPKVYQREELAFDTVQPSQVDVAGRWEGSWTDPKKNSTFEITLTLLQSGNHVTGEIVDESGKRWEILEGVVSGENINLFYDLASPSWPTQGATLLGEVDGNQITGNYYAHQKPRPGAASKGEWQVRRSAANPPLKFKR